jgi:hypothetical protein
VAPKIVTDPVNDPTACLCSLMRREDGVTTECNQGTAKRFAIGHDAKMKGFLIRAGVAGLTVTNIRTGETKTAQEVADEIGFSAQVARGIDLGLANLASKKMLGGGRIGEGATPGFGLGPNWRERQGATAAELAQVVAKTEAEHAAAELQKVLDRQASADW